MEDQNDMQQQIDDAIQQLIAAMQARFIERYPKNPPKVWSVKRGKKYLKICDDGSVHAFVDADGNMYKAAGWNAPAKGIRFNIIKDLPKLLKIADYAGGYLYR